MTKNAEMKWVVTKGNENLSIKPLSFLGDMRRPVWVADRRSEFRMIRMGLDQVSLGADPYLPRGLIESFLRVFKHFAFKIPRGKV